MKLSGHFCFALLTILVLATCPGCASTARQEGMQKYFDDGILPIKVKVAFFNAPSLLCENRCRGPGLVG